MEEIEADIVVTDERIPNLLVLKVELNTSVWYIINIMCKLVWEYKNIIFFKLNHILCYRT
jgi:hypothetical protein